MTLKCSHFPTELDQSTHTHHCTPFLTRFKELTSFLHSVTASASVVKMMVKSQWCRYSGSPTIPYFHFKTDLKNFLGLHSPKFSQWCSCIQHLLFVTPTHEYPPITLHLSLASLVSGRIKIEVTTTTTNLHRARYTRCLCY